MSRSLYQKYRPRTWAELTSQNHIKVTLEHEIARGLVTHAYLFVGPRGVGKTTTARLLAKAVNCLQRKAGSAEPCNQCDSCERIQAGRSFDLIEIDAASHTGVDHVREHILGAAEVHAGQGAYRVFIIDEVHMLSTAAFNAMLKMLEEPPGHAIFILATTEAHKVPATIISRCQRFDFKKVPAEAMRERLLRLSEQEGVDVEAEVLAAIAEHAEGSLRDAESVLGQVLALGGKRISMDEASLIIPRSNLKDAATIVEHCLRRQPAEALAFANKLAEEGVAIPVLMQDTIAWLRNVLLAKVSGRLDLFAQTTVGERQERVLAQAAESTVSQLCSMLDIFLNRRQRLADSPLPQLPLELAIIESCTIGDPPEGSPSGAGAA